MMTYLRLGAVALGIAVVGFAVWHYVALREEAARVPALEQAIEAKDAEIADRDTKMRDEARRIDALTTRLSEIDADREKAEAALLATQSAIEKTAAAAVEELARAIPDNPACAYPDDVGRVLREQLDGIRPGHTD